MNNQLEVSQKINTTLNAVLGQKAIHGFEKAFVMSSAIVELRKLLSDEYMKPIMLLQGSRIGFKTDKDKEGGYSIAIVKECLIEAVMAGLQPYGNEFNIIAGNMYPTREGFSSLLNKELDLKKSFSYLDVFQSADKNKANVKVEIIWKIGNGEANKQIETFSIKSGANTSFDALIGKAERKAKRWLYNTIKGTNYSDGDVTDIDFKVVSDKQMNAEQRSIILDYCSKLGMRPETEYNNIQANLDLLTYTEAIKAITYLESLK